jgi:dTDP-4-dehydrorhamnose 3,5-epimerase
VELIDGVEKFEPKNVLVRGGHLTEVYRDDWPITHGAIQQIFQRTLLPGAVSAWHSHGHTTDRLFALSGQLRIVLYDARPDSPTHGRINQFIYGSLRPGLVLVPPGVWHGVQNIGNEPGALLNFVDHPYRYQDPDHWRLPQDTPQIPFQW